LRRLTLLITAAVWLLVPALSWGYDLLIVQSQRSPAYDEVLRGMRSVARFSERTIVLSDYNEVDLVRIAREENPIAIVTLGDKALAAGRKVRSAPVIALMALSYHPGSSGHPAITGIEVQAPAERYLKLFASIKAARVGVLVGSGNSAAYIRQARRIAAKYDIELITREVKSPREVSGQLDSLAGMVDALWMLPDAITSSGKSADAHFMFSAANSVPAITLSSVYLASGAAFALDIDRFDIGKQAGEMALSLINGYAVSDVPAQLPRKVSTKSNPSILKRFAIVTNSIIQENNQ
jgi:putative ABC transport system substrate-binding protein